MEEKKVTEATENVAEQVATEEVKTEVVDAPAAPAITIADVMNVFIGTEKATDENNQTRISKVLKFMAESSTITPKMNGDIADQMFYSAELGCTIRAFTDTDESDNETIVSELIVDKFKVSDRKDKKLVAVKKYLPADAIIERVSDEDTTRYYKVTCGDSVFTGQVTAVNEGTATDPKWVFAVCYYFIDVLTPAQVEELEETVEKTDEATTASAFDQMQQMVATSENTDEDDDEDDDDEYEVLDEDDDDEDDDDEDEDEESSSQRAFEQLKQMAKVTEKSRKKHRKEMLESAEHKQKVLHALKVTGIIVGSVMVAAGVAYLIYRIVTKH